VSSASWRIEDILMAAGLATAEDLERARRRMRERGGRLLASLHALGRFDDDTFARGLGNAFQVPVADASRLARVAAPRTPSRRAALRALAIERVLLPIGASREPREVEVAMFDPTDREGIDRLRAICGGADVRITVAPRGALLDAIAKTYGREASGVLETPVPAPHVTLIHDDDDVITQTAVPVAPSVGDTTDPGLEAAPADGDAVADSEELTPPPRIPHRDLRLHRVLLEAVGLLADLLEERVSRRPRSGKELARYARLVGRELGMAPATVDELGAAASLHAVERALAEPAAASGELGVQLDEALGWSAGSPDGIGPMLRALRRAPLLALGAEDLPYGAIVIAAVREFLGLAHLAPDGHPDMDTVNQLLRVTTPEEIILALGRVVTAERQKEQGDAV
jgi:hypothetical protein